MPSPNTLLAFAAASLLLLVLPGPAVMYIVTRSASQGRAAGLVSVAGIHLGTVVHIVAAMVGLSAILAASATAFTVVKLVGAAYLIWLGIQSLRAYRSASANDTAEESAPRPLRRIFTDGVVLNILNPKTAIFFLSFVPQFVDADAAAPAGTIAILGAVFIGVGLFTDGAYAMFGGWVGQRIAGSATVRRRRDLFAGGSFIGLGLVTAVTGGSSS